MKNSNFNKRKTEFNKIKNSNMNQSKEMNVKYKKESSYQFEYQTVKLNMIAGQNICYCQFLAFFFLS